MISLARELALLPPAVRDSTWAALLIAPSGLRSSWPSMARNSSFVRLADSASARAASCWPKSRAFWMATAVCSARRTQIVSSSSVNERGVRLVR